MESGGITLGNSLQYKTFSAFCSSLLGPTLSHFTRGRSGQLYDRSSPFSKAIGGANETAALRCRNV